MPLPSHPSQFHFFTFKTTAHHPFHTPSPAAVDFIEAKGERLAKVFASA